MRVTGPVLIAIAAILWGVDGILRRSLQSVEPVAIVFYEHLIGAVLLLPFLIRGWRVEKLTRKEWQAILLVSLLSGVLGTLFFTTALAKVNYIPFSVVFLLQKLQPVFTVAFAALILRERVTRHYVGWAALAIGAAYFVTFPGGQVNMADGSSAAMAALYALLAAIAWASSTAFSRYTLLNHSHTFITGLRFALTTLIALPFVFVFASGHALPSLESSQVLRLFAIAFSSGMVALWIYYRGLKATSASVATIIELLFPLTAVLIDYLVYDKLLAPSQYLASIVLLFAAYRVAKHNAAH